MTAINNQVDPTSNEDVQMANYYANDHTIPSLANLNIKPDS